MALFICCEKSFLETVWADVKIGTINVEQQAAEYERKR